MCLCVSLCVLDSSMAEEKVSKAFCPPESVPVPLLEIFG